MTSAEPPRWRVRFLGVRERPADPPIHATDTQGDEDETLCGIPIDPSRGVIGMPEPYMSAQAIAEMITSNVPPCPLCRTLATAAVGPPSEQ